MANPYVLGVALGSVVLVGYLIWTIFDYRNNTNNRYHESDHTFNPGPGYDRPRDNWEDDNRSEHSRRRRGRAECAICAEPLAGMEMRRLPCSHVFHDDCISKWFQESRTCPTCRRSS